MAEFRWIKTSLFLMLALQFTATLEQYTSSTVRVGDEVTLPCRDVTEDQDECDDITWSFTSRNLKEELFLYGQMIKNTKADRLNVTENCSLVIKKVIAEDAGQYICQHELGTNQVYLFVVTMTEQKHNDQVILNCSVSTYEECTHTVKWLYDKDSKDMMTSPSGCSASVTTSLSESKHHELFKCEVTNTVSRKCQQFIYQDSDEKTGEDEKTSTSKPTTTPRTKPTLRKTPATTPPATTTANKSTSTVTNNISTDSNTQAQGQGWWWLILPVVLAALFVVALITWKRTKGNRAQLGSNTADPEDGVSYTSVSFTKTNSKAQVNGNDGDNEGDAVTYSTVKASSST